MAKNLIWVFGSWLIAGLQCHAWLFSSFCSLCRRHRRRRSSSLPSMWLRLAARVAPSLIRFFSLCKCKLLHTRTQVPEIFKRSLDCLFAFFRMCVSVPAVGGYSDTLYAQDESICRMVFFVFLFFVARIWYSIKRWWRQPQHGNDIAAHGRLELTVAFELRISY